MTLANLISIFLIPLPQEFIGYYALVQKKIIPVGVNMTSIYCLILGFSGIYHMMVKEKNTLS